VVATARRAAGAYVRPGCGCPHRYPRGLRVRPAARGASGFASRAAAVTGMVMARFSVAVSPQVVLADVQAGKQPARKAEPAMYAGRDERAGHAVLH